jgi:hypothetical protein
VDLCLVGLRLVDLRLVGLRLVGLRLVDLRLVGLRLVDLRLVGLRLVDLRLVGLRLVGLHLVGRMVLLAALHRYIFLVWAYLPLWSYPSKWNVSRPVGTSYAWWIWLIRAYGSE